MIQRLHQIVPQQKAIGSFRECCTGHEDSFRLLREKALLGMKGICCSLVRGEYRVQKNVTPSLHDYFLHKTFLIIQDQNEAS